MPRKILFALMTLLLVLALAGCEGTSGSSVGASKSCRANNNGTQCEGSFRKISGTVGEEMTVSGGLSDVEVAVRASVETGTVRVYVINSNGARTESVAQPGEPADFSALGEVEYDSMDEEYYVNVYFEASEASATGIAYSVDITYP